MPERGFLIFWIFLLFFWNFLARVEYERNSGLKFFSLLLGLSHPVLAKNNTGKRVFPFLNFFGNFLQNFLARIEYERNSGLKFFFFSFSAYLIPFWLKIIPERGFLIFCNFFRNFVVRVEYERNSGLSIFSHSLSISHLVLAKNNAGNMFFSFLNFFAIFFEIFLLGSSMSEIWD